MRVGIFMFRLVLLFIFVTIYCAYPLLDRSPTDAYILKGEIDKKSDFVNSQASRSKSVQHELPKSDDDAVKSGKAKIAKTLGSAGVILTLPTYNNEILQNDRVKQSDRVKQDDRGKKTKSVVYGDVAKSSHVKRPTFIGGNPKIDQVEKPKTRVTNHSDYVLPKSTNNTKFVENVFVPSIPADDVISPKSTNDTKLDRKDVDSPIPTDEEDDVISPKSTNDTKLDGKDVVSPKSTNDTKLFEQDFVVPTEEDAIFPQVNETKTADDVAPKSKNDTAPSISTKDTLPKVNETKTADDVAPKSKNDTVPPITQDEDTLPKVNDTKPVNDTVPPITQDEDTLPKVNNTKTEGKDTDGSVNATDVSEDTPVEQKTTTESTDHAVTFVPSEDDDSGKGSILDTFSSGFNPMIPFKIGYSLIAGASLLLVLFLGVMVCCRRKPSRRNYVRFKESCGFNNHRGGGGI